LEQAARESGVPINVSWMPFFLDPNTPKEGEDLLEHLIAKYGKSMVERFSAPNNPLDQAGQRVGISFNKSRRFINTIDCHRLMEWCNRTTPEKSDALMESLFHAYFEEAKDLSNREQLIEVAVGSGFERSVLEEIVNSETYHDEVIRADREGKQRYRVSGVPFFIIEPADGSRPTAFSGAQVSYLC
jgi:predicted DsbA family dithiol-disulfide isomerase